VLRTSTAVTTTNVGSAATAYNNITPVQLVASTPFDVAAFQLRCNSSIFSTGSRRDVAGAASSEYSIAGPFTWGGRATGSRMTLPLFIPAGTRLSLRIRTPVLSANTAWTLDLYQGVNRDSVGLPQRWMAYGLVDDATANARGTIATPGNTNTWGAWTAITTSTTYAHDLWLPQTDPGTFNGGTLAALTYRSQFAFASTTDAATAATNGTVVEGPGTVTGTTESCGSPYQGGTTALTQFGIGGDNFGLVYHPLAAGSAISFRGMCSGTADANAFAGSILAAL
jgi:hypothetical protein